MAEQQSRLFATEGESRMTLSTAAWSWPQYAILVYYFLHVAVNVGRHGKPLPYVTYNGGMAALRVLLLIFFLIAGNFFQ